MSSPLVLLEAGLLYRSDGTLTGWSGDAQWTSASDPQFVCYPIPRVLLGPTADAASAGIREGQLFIDGNDPLTAAWFLLYDGGNGTTGWRQFLASSTDRGISWTRLGALSMGLAKVVSGSWAAVATGWLEKRGSTYYLHRVVATTVFGSPNTGLPSGDYLWDCWTNTVLGVSGWAAAANVPAGNQRYDLGGAFTSNHLPGGMVLDGSTYRNFSQGRGGGDYLVGMSVGGNPDGPFTPPGSALADSATSGFDGRTPENPRVFFSTTLNRFAMLVNLINVADTATDANAIGYSTSLTDWAAAIWRRTQGLGPMDTSGGAVGIQTHATGVDGLLIKGPHGEVPIIYDADPTNFSPGWHIERSIRGAVLEPSASCLSIAQAANTTVYAIRRSLSQTALVIELAICVTAAHGGGMGFSVEYRGDSTGQNCYRCTMNTLSGLALEKVVSNSASTLATSSGSFIFAEPNQVYRIKIAVAGNVHTLTFEGETHVSYTDTASPITSGTHLGLRAHGATLQVRNLNVRTSDVMIVTGLPAASTIWLRSLGGFPVASGESDEDGEAMIAAAHWPHYAIEVDGVDYTPDAEALWGGDTVRVSGSGRFASVFAGVIR